MGAVTLLVGDLDGMTRYYRDVVTLAGALGRRRHRHARPRRPARSSCCRHEPALRHATPGSAGLFHTAILFETQAALAAALYSVARHAPGTFTGSADHLVSQAFYFTDPEGNGIELYWDRARTEWSWMHGQIEMATLYLDPNAFLGEHLTEEAAQRRDRAGTRHPSVMCTCRWGMSRPRAPSTSTPSASTRRPDSATRPCSSAPAATTTTWR